MYGSFLFLNNIFHYMLSQQAVFPLTPNLTLTLGWAARTPAFVQEWQNRLQAAEQVSDQIGEHVVEATSMVLSTVEHLDERTAQVLTDLYRLSGQLPAPTDKLLVGPLELRVEERQFVVSHQKGIKQVAITYCIDIVRYRYEAAQLVSLSAIRFPLPT